MLTVLTPATYRRLTTRLAVELATGYSPENYMRITAASGMVQAYLGRTLAIEEVEETFLQTRASWSLCLSRWPVREVVSVVEDGRDVAQSEFEVDGPTGILRRRWNGRAASWMAVPISVRYWAGYILPQEIIEEPADRDLPADIEQAVILLVAAAASATSRDPSVRRTQIGAVEVEFFNTAGGAVTTGLPPAVLALLEPHRQPRLA